MANTGELYRVFYVAKNFTTGLTDVELTVVRPDGVKDQITMSELDANTPQTKGIYFVDILPSMEGEYLFIVDSISLPRKDVKSVVFSLEAEATPVIEF